MPCKEYRTHCKVCDAPITDSTQRTTCLEHRQRQTVRVVATCPCGKPAENIRAKYCGPECRKKWGKKPPARMVTKTCLGCGEEFSRPHYFPGKMNYCSNACSHRQQKKVRDKFVLNLNEHAVVFHSGWEIRFWAVCLRFDIPIRSYDGPDITTSEGVYRPDFIVNDQVVDVKGWLRPESAAKIGEAREQVDVMLIDESALCALESGDLSALKTRARKV